VDKTPTLVELIGALRRDLDTLREENTALHQENVTLRRENAALKQKVAELLRRLDKNSSNSSKPPSSDGLKKPPRVFKSLRGRSGKSSGGQVGHKGDTLREVDKPDRIERHAATTCRHCKACLTAAMVTREERRQVFDLPQPRLEVTEHRASVYCCLHCNGVTKAAFPDTVAAHVQYGSRVRATAVYLNVQQLIPEDRVCETMADLFAAASLCPASVVAWTAKAAEAQAPVVAHIAARVVAAKVRHLDETGFRIGGKTRWLHSASTAVYTLYRIGETRGDVPRTMANGVIVHDHFKPYYTLRGPLHALCNAHHLRELQALIEIEKEAWAGVMHELLCAANKQVRQAKAGDAVALAEADRQRIAAAYDAALVMGFDLHEGQAPLVRSPGARGRPPRRTGHNLLLRLRDCKDDVLRFIADFDVPFTNNQAERDIRMMKLRMKISGGFRTLAGAETFATMRSVISTIRKHGINILRALTMPTGDLVDLLSA
jgi:transposase/FtsZ-binding cell division protein ZapB